MYQWRTVIDWWGATMDWVHWVICLAFSGIQTYAAGPTWTINTVGVNVCRHADWPIKQTMGTCCALVTWMDKYVDSWGFMWSSLINETKALYLLGGHELGRHIKRKVKDIIWDLKFDIGNTFGDFFKKMVFYLMWCRRLVILESVHALGKFQQLIINSFLIPIHPLSSPTKIHFSVLLLEGNLTT